MLKKLRTYFGFTRREQKGIVVLLILIILVWGIRIALPWFYGHDFASSDHQKLAEAKKWKQHYLELLYMDSVSRAEQRKKWDEPKTAPPEKVTELFSFDPNNTSQEDWQRLGLSRKQAAVIEKYLNKGGRFRKAEDLRKIYVISDGFFERVKDSVFIPPTLLTEYDESNKKGKKDSQSPVYKPAKKYVSFYDTLMVEINSADTARLKMLPGIGSYYARMIVKYREMLGGYYAPDQLLEVYGMDSTRLNGILKNISLDTLKIRKFDINKVSFKELLRHPYMEYYIVKSIFNHKDEHGDFENISGLLDVKLIYKDLYLRMRPYLKTKE